MKDSALFLGIDVGTGGVRLSAVNSTGDVPWTRSVPLDQVPLSTGGIHEQDPDLWWSAICNLSGQFVRERSSTGASGEVLGIAVTSTSGTLVAVDDSGVPTGPALMYDDQRAGGIAAELNLTDGPGQQWTAGHSFTKALWLRNHLPQ
jgi:sugar (pentulose or hexulose) kinase